MNFVKNKLAFCLLFIGAIGLIVFIIKIGPNIPSIASGGLNLMASDQSKVTGMYYSSDLGASSSAASEDEKDKKKNKKGVVEVIENPDAPKFAKGKEIKDLPDTKPEVTPTPKPTPTPRPTKKPKATEEPVENPLVESKEEDEQEVVIFDVSKIPLSTKTMEKTERIVKYYQGAQSYKSGLQWSGNWCYKKYNGKKFGSFGCGICSLANVYASLTKFGGSPIDMLEFLKSKASYKGAGAVSWSNLAKGAKKLGFTASTGKKPSKYKDFQNIMKKSKAMIVLVGKGKKSHWKKTSGHYISLFLYEKKNDIVFVADSGSLKNNGQWIPLKVIYNSLKKSSERQFLSFKSYNKKADTWKNKVFTGTCIYPSNWKVQKENE